MDLGQDLVARGFHAFVLLIYIVFFSGDWAHEEDLCRLDNALVSLQHAVPLNRDNHAIHIVVRRLLMIIYTLRQSAVTAESGVDWHRAPRRANVIDGWQGRGGPLRSHVGFGGRTRQCRNVRRAALPGHKVDALLKLVGLGHRVKELLVGKVMFIKIALL